MAKQLNDPGIDDLILRSHRRQELLSSGLALQPKEQYEVRLGERAFSALLRQCEAILYQQVHRIASFMDVGEAYAIAVDGFRVAVTTYSSESPFICWLRIKVRGALLDYRKKHFRIAARDEDVEYFSRLEYEETPIDEPEFNPDELRPGLRSFLDSLTSVQREILSLHAHKESWAAVGEWLGVTADAARRRFVRIRDKMLRLFSITEQAEEELPEVAQPMPKRSPSSPFVAFVIFIFAWIEPSFLATPARTFKRKIVRWASLLFGTAFPPWSPFNPQKSTFFIR